MGSLTPGATYIYERANGRIYARESGKTDRIVVGYDTSVSPEQMYMSEWNEIIRTAETNPALQEALDRVKILYTLSKSDE